MHQTVLIVPQPCNIKTDQEITTFHFCTIYIGISKRAVCIIEIISVAGSAGNSYPKTTGTSERLY